MYLRLFTPFMVFALSTVLHGQSVEIKKNANNDPCIELLSPQENTFIGQFTGFLKKVRRIVH